MSDTTTQPVRAIPNSHEREKARQLMGLWVSEFWRLAGEEETRALFEERVTRLRNTERERNRGV